MLLPFPSNSLLSDFHQICWYFYAYIFSSPPPLPVSLLPECARTHVYFAFSPSLANLEVITTMSWWFWAHCALIFDSTDTELLQMSIYSLFLPLATLNTSRHANAHTVWSFLTDPQSPEAPLASLMTPLTEHFDLSVKNWEFKGILEENLHPMMKHFCLNGAGRTGSPRAPGETGDFGLTCLSNQDHKSLYDRDTHTHTLNPEFTTLGLVISAKLKRLNPNIKQTGPAHTLGFKSSSLRGQCDFIDYFPHYTALLCSLLSLFIVVVTLKEISYCSPPQISRPVSYPPSSQNHSLSTANSPPAITGDLKHIERHSWAWMGTHGNWLQNLPGWPYI